MPNKIDPELGDVPPAVHESEVSRQQQVAALTATREPSLHSTRDGSPGHPGLSLPIWSLREPPRRLDAADYRGANGLFPVEGVVALPC